MPRRLTINLAPVHYEDTEINIGIIECKDNSELEEKLGALRKRYNHSHVFRRSDRTQIISVPTIENTDPIGKIEKIRLKDHWNLCAALIRNSLLNYLHKLGRNIRSYDPIRFVADNSNLVENKPESDPSE